MFPSDAVMTGADLGFPWFIAVVNSESEKGTSRSSLGDGTGIIGRGGGEVRLAYGKKALIMFSSAVAGSCVRTRVANKGGRFFFFSPRLR